MALPQRGKLDWHVQYFEVGEAVMWYSWSATTGTGKPTKGVIAKVSRNRFGRVSYFVKAPRRASLVDCLLEQFLPVDLRRKRINNGALVG
jgi:hypothetical protein